MKPSQNAPRFVHWIFAKINGYFWLPCPMCGKNFGGHERGGYLATSPGRSVGTCINCKNAAAEESRRRQQGEPWTTANRWQFEQSQLPRVCVYENGVFCKYAHNDGTEATKEEYDNAKAEFDKRWAGGWESHVPQVNH